MKAVVTGATGFLGGHVTRLLAERGDEVRVTYRNADRLKHIKGIEYRRAKADVLDFKAMRRAMKGSDVLFHTVGFVGSNPAELVWRMNAHAPVIAVEAAAAEGLKRVVLTSTISAIGPTTNGRPANEETEYPRDWLGLAYPDSKHEGELAAVEAGERHGIEVVVVNPAYLLGVPVDRDQPGETSTRTVGNYLRCRLPGVIDAPMNFADVVDAAAGHLLAADKGKPGERYILGGENLSWPELIDHVARRVRHPPPRDGDAAPDRPRGPDPRGDEAARGAAGRGLRADVQGLALLVGEGQARARLHHPADRRDDRRDRRLVPRADRRRRVLRRRALEHVDDRHRALHRQLVRAAAPDPARAAPVWPSRPGRRVSLPPPGHDSTCLITGASSGIGAELARGLAERGHGVTLVARRKDRLVELAEELADAHGVRAEAIGADVSNPRSRSRLYGELNRRGLTVEVLVNNAGYGSGGRFTELDEAKEAAMVATNCEAVVALTRHFLPAMAERGRGAVLNLASLIAFQPVPFQATYGATKAFVLSFTEALHEEMRGTGVTLTAVCPARCGPSSARRAASAAPTS